MTYVKFHGIWHIMYKSTMDHSIGTMVAETICGDSVVFDSMARGEDEKSDQVCSDCENLLRSGDKLLRDTFPDEK